MMQPRRTVPRRASRFAPTIQPRALRPHGKPSAPVFRPKPAIARRPRLGALRQSLSRIEQRTLLPIALSCLVLGLLFGLTGAFGDSVVASHAGKAAMIFGFAGLRRVAGFGPEAVDASA